MTEFVQHSLGWHRARLGKITGSRAGVLTGRKRGTDEFNDTALAYVYEVAAQRYMNRRIVEDDELFTEYLAQTNYETAAMRWGTENEEIARDIYAKKTQGTDKGARQRGASGHTVLRFVARRLHPQRQRWQVRLH